MTGLSTTKLLAGMAALAIGLGVPAAADASHLRHHHHRYLVRLVPPPPVPAAYDNPLYIPGERNDPDLGSTPADSLALSRERPLLSTEDVRRDFGVVPGPGFEIEGPPIGDSLPVIR